MTPLDHSHFDKAIIIICLGINPTARDKPLKSLLVCSGVLDYFRAIQGRGYIMTINFSGSKLLQATTPAMLEACLREDGTSWASVLRRAEERISRDAPQQCGHCEIVCVGTDQVPFPAAEDGPAVWSQRLRRRGIRVNSIVVQDEPGTAGSYKNGSWRMLTPSAQYDDDSDTETEGRGIGELARATGGLTLEPNAEGKLAVHQLFGEMFRRWGEDYWRSASSRDQW